MPTSNKRPRISVVTGTITRLANTTTYGAADVMSDSATVLTFENAVALKSGSGVIRSASITSSNPTSTNFSLDLFLFHTAPAVQTDNVVDALSDAEALTCLGVIEFLAANANDATNWIQVPAVGLDLPLGIRAANSSLSIFGVPIMRAAHVPLSAEVIEFSLGIEQG